MGIRTLAAVLVALSLVGCGGGGSGGGGKNGAAASACDASAKQTLGAKTYQLDLDVLGASMAAQPDGSQLLKGPVVIEPGLATESKQTQECNVRFTDGKDAPDVLRVQFIW
jgi:hypothetical protein